MARSITRVLVVVAASYVMYVFPLRVNRSSRRRRWIPIFRQRYCRARQRPRHRRPRPGRRARLRFLALRLRVRPVAHEEQPGTPPRPPFKRTRFELPSSTPQLARPSAAQLSLLQDCLSIVGTIAVDEMETFTIRDMLAAIAVKLDVDIAQIIPLRQQIQRRYIAMTRAGEEQAYGTGTMYEMPFEAVDEFDCENEVFSMD